MKIRYIGYTLNLFKPIAAASPTRAATANFLEFSKYLQFVTLALVLSTRQCRHSSLYCQVCNELLIIFYITDVTSHTWSLFGKTYSTKFLIGFYVPRKKKYRMSQEEWTKLRESVPYVELYRYNPKHLYPKLNGYGD